MEHPFLSLSPARFRIAFLISFVATIGIAMLLQSFAPRFATRTDAEGKSFDTVAFELAYTTEAAIHMTETWGAEGRDAFWWQTIFDYGFLVAYSNAIAFGVLAVASRGLLHRYFLGFAVFLAYGQWFAAICDAVENSLLLVILDGNAAAPLPQLAAMCAGVKFAFVAAGLLFFLLGLPFRVFAMRANA